MRTTSPVTRRHCLRILALALALIAGDTLTAQPGRSPAAAQKPAAGQPPVAPVSPGESNRNEWDFNFLPRALRRNPLVDMTVLTEMTDAGRKRPPASPEAPVYYLARTTPLREMGDRDAGIHPPPPLAVEQWMQHALASRGFLPADARHPATLLLIYHWGVFNRPPPYMEDVRNRNALGRAALVGGDKFAEEYSKALYDAGILIEAGAFLPFSNPLKRLREHSDVGEDIFDQAQSNLYFLIASAYDLDSVAHGQRQLLWRTKMTAQNHGVALADTLPVIIAASAPYLGRELKEPIPFRRSVNAEGRVHLGPVKTLDLPAEGQAKPDSK